MAMNNEFRLQQPSTSSAPPAFTTPIISNETYYDISSDDILSDEISSFLDEVLNSLDNSPTSSSSTSNLNQVQSTSIPDLNQTQPTSETELNTLSVPASDPVQTFLLSANSQETISWDEELTPETCMLLDAYEEKAQECIKLQDEHKNCRKKLEESNGQLENLIFYAEQSIALKLQQTPCFQANKKQCTHRKKIKRLKKYFREAKRKMNKEKESAKLSNLPLLRDIECAENMENGDQNSFRVPTINLLKSSAENMENGDQNSFRVPTINLLKSNEVNKLPVTNVLYSDRDNTSNGFTENRKQESENFKQDLQIIKQDLQIIKQNQQKILNLMQTNGAGVYELLHEQHMSPLPQDSNFEEDNID